MDAADLEILTVGRVSVDLYPEQLNTPTRYVRTYRKSIGGTATNVAVAAARLGRRAGVVTKVGDDRFGDYIRHALAETFNVDTRYVATDPELLTPLAFAELNPPDDPLIFFYREPRAPDMNLVVDDIDLEVVRSVPILWIPASRFAFEPSRTTVHRLLDERSRSRHVILDLDWRPMFWPSGQAAHEEIDGVLDRVTMAIGNRAECVIAVGSDDPDEAADRLLDRGLDAAIVKLGGDGVLVASVDGTRERIAPYPVTVVCGLGAGDAFGGAICHGLLSGWDLPTAAAYANAAGAVVAGKLMCADDMPTAPELDSFLRERAS
ncbi:MAG: 5-dehydro-2-deoxygluconokinase [Acidimicrobiia bacterium]|nr:5-dehydro-2-deoxygluconokinase [Acidimicrobiia bacterium]